MGTPGKDFLLFLPVNTIYPVTLALCSFIRTVGQASECIDGKSNYLYELFSFLPPWVNYLLVYVLFCFLNGLKGLTRDV